MPKKPIDGWYVSTEPWTHLWCVGMCPANWEIQSEFCPYRELSTEYSPVLPATFEPERQSRGGEEEDEEGGGQALGEGEGRLQLLIMILLLRYVS